MFLLIYFFYNRPSDLKDYAYVGVLEICELMYNMLVYQNKVLSEQDREVKTLPGRCGLD